MFRLETFGGFSANLGADVSGLWSGWVYYGLDFMKLFENK
jgi:hypothetical protein